MASLLGTGVDSLVEDLGVCLGVCFGVGLGRELAFVVSRRHNDCLLAGVFLLRGDDAGAGLEGGAFWKKETMERCLAEEEGAAGLVALEGVLAVVGAIVNGRGSTLERGIVNIVISDA